MEGGWFNPGFWPWKGLRPPSNLMIRLDGDPEETHPRSPFLVRTPIRNTVRHTMTLRLYGIVMALLLVKSFTLAPERLQAPRTARRDGVHLAPEQGPWEEHTMMRDAC